MNPQILYDISEAVHRKKQQGKDIIKLNVGEPEQSPPQNISALIKESIDNGRTTYGPAAGDPTLRNALAQSHYVKAENILIGPGSKFLLYATLHLLNRQYPDSTIFIPHPAWSAFPLMLTDLGFKRPKFLKTMVENNWKITPDQLKKTKINRGDTLIITSPNNPTSTLYSEGEFNLLKKATGKKGALIMKDCAYQDLAFRQLDSSVDLTHTIEVHSFSKKFCMTGFRLGYIIANEDLIARLTKFMQITVSCVPLFIQDAAISLLKNNADFPREIAAIYEKRAQLAQKILQSAGITFAPAQAGFYLFADLHSDTTKLAYKLINRGVAVVPGTAFGPYPNYVRISLTEKEERLDRGLQTLSSTQTSS